MTPERWKDIKRTFDEALSLDRAEREGFLKRLQEADPEMSSEVESLLIAHEAKPSFLETPYVDAAHLERGP
ncbi:MAG TPA: hypothetical protein VK437_00200, partial [Steroidobacteraceae bacterium]|nr:hypothetical protein [Steroidobacteraceae bacterium]